MTNNVSKSARWHNSDFIPTKNSNLIDPSCQPKEITPKRKMVVCRRLRRLKVVLQIFELVRTGKIIKIEEFESIPKIQIFQKLQPTQLPTY